MYYWPYLLIDLLCLSNIFIRNISRVNVNNLIRFGYYTFILHQYRQYLYQLLCKILQYKNSKNSNNVKCSYL